MQPSEATSSKLLVETSPRLEVRRESQLAEILAIKERQAQIIKQTCLVPPTLATESMERSMARESKSGQTHPGTSESGRTTRPTDMEHSFTPMETSTKDNGLMTRLMARALTSMQTEPLMRATGLKTSSTVKVLRPGQTVLVTTVATRTERRTGRES